MEFIGPFFPRNSGRAGIARTPQTWGGASAEALPHKTTAECRDERRFAWLTGLRQDIVFGLRMMRRTPVVTAAAILSLALGIGANTAIVSLTLAILLVAAVAAVSIPALRASGLEPSETLRQE